MGGIYVAGMRLVDGSADKKDGVPETGKFHLQ